MSSSVAICRTSTSTNTLKRLTRNTFIRYDDSWELSESSVAQRLYGSDLGLSGLLSADPSVKNQNERPKNGFKYSTMDSELEQPLEPSVRRVAKEIRSLQPQITLLDLRDPASFAVSHLPGADNFPLSSLTDTTPSAFSSSNILEMQWRELESLCTDERVELLKRTRVVLVDYDGDTARVATSVFRAKDIVAWSLRKGMKGLATGIPSL